MIDGIGREQIIYLGFSKDMLGKLGGSLPEASVLVLEEPDVIRKRDLRSPVPGLPLVSRIVECEYLVPSALDRMLAKGEYFIRAAAVVPGRIRGRGHG